MLEKYLSTSKYILFMTKIYEIKKRKYFGRKENQQYAANYSR